MASVLSAARDRVAALAVTAFSITGNNRLFDVATAEKLDWRQLMQRVEQDATAAGIAPPYAVLAYAPARQVDSSLRSVTYEQMIHVLYVGSLRNGSTTKTSMALRTEIEDALISLQNSILTDTNGAIQSWDSEIDCDEGNAPNSYYMTTGTMLYAGILRMNLMVGYLL
jgi:hypothetical protein